MALVFRNKFQWANIDYAEVKIIWQSFYSFELDPRLVLVLRLVLDVAQIIHIRKT